jgi:hypothetical protein
MSDDVVWLGLDFYLAVDDDKTSLPGVITGWIGIPGSLVPLWVVLRSFRLTRLNDEENKRLENEKLRRELASDDTTRNAKDQLLINNSLEASGALANMHGLIIRFLLLYLALAVWGLLRELLAPRHRLRGTVRISRLEPDQQLRGRPLRSGSGGDLVHLGASARLRHHLDQWPAFDQGRASYVQTVN